MKGLVAILLLFATAISQSAPGKKNEPPVNAADPYVHARSLEKAGRLGEALASYKDTAFRNKDLEFYSVVPLTRAARSTGNLILERLLLLRSMTAGGKAASAARGRFARSAFESENYREAIDLLTTGTSIGRPDRDIQVLLGEAYLYAAQPEQAGMIFRRIEDGSNASQPDDAAIHAVKGLDMIGGDVPEPEHLRRAEVFQADRDLVRARRHFLAVIDGAPNGPAAAECVFQIGRGYSVATDHAEAITWYERVLEQYPGSAQAKDALLYAASAYARVGKPREAIKRYQRFIELYPDDEKLDRAYLNIVDVYRDQGEDREALKWCEKAESIFKGKPAEAVAIFAEVRILMSKEVWPDALRALQRLRQSPDLGGAIPGGTDAAEVTFLWAYVLEQLGRYDESIDAYLSIPEGRDNYYGMRANARLSAMAKNETARGFIDQKVGSLATQLKTRDARSTAAAASILRLSENPDLRASAFQVLKASTKPIGLPPSGNPQTTDLLSPGSVEDGYPAANSIAAAESEFRRVPADYPIELIPKERLRLLYPTAFGDAVLRYSRPRGLDPRFVLSIMRQESRFDPFAHSSASARGLMQLIASTAAVAAANVGRIDADAEDLYDPDFAILLGTQHISDLFRSFPEQPESVAASYNAGEENVRRWSARSRSGSADRYVPEIMFTQTKDYVLKVMASYRMYQYLYDEELNPK